VVRAGILAALLALPAALAAQDDYEIQVYGAETATIGYDVTQKINPDWGPDSR
jgi:hypothetical protein